MLSDNVAQSGSIEHLSEVELASVVRRHIPGSIGEQAAEFIIQLKVSGRTFKELVEEDLDVLSKNDPNLTRVYMDLQGNGPRQRRFPLHTIYLGPDPPSSMPMRRSSSDALPNSPVDGVGTPSSSTGAPLPQEESNQLDTWSFEPDIRANPSGRPHLKLCAPLQPESTQTSGSTMKATGIQAGSVRPCSIPGVQVSSSSVPDPRPDFSWTPCHLDGGLAGNSNPCSDAIEPRRTICLSGNIIGFVDLGLGSGCPPDPSVVNDWTDFPPRPRGTTVIDPLDTSTIRSSQERAETHTDLDVSPTSDALDFQCISPVPTPCGANPASSAVLNLPQNEAAFSVDLSISPGSVANQTSSNTAGHIYNANGDFISTAKPLHFSPPHDTSTPSPHTILGAVPCSLDVRSDILLNVSDLDDGVDWGLTELFHLPILSVPPSPRSSSRSKPVFADEVQGLNDITIDGVISPGGLHAGMESVNPALARRGLDVTEGFWDGSSLLSPEPGCADNGRLCAETSLSQENIVVHDVAQPRPDCSPTEGEVYSPPQSRDLFEFCEKEQENVSHVLFLSPLPRLPTFLSDLEDYGVSSSTAVIVPLPLSENVTGQQAHVVALDKPNLTPEITDRHMALDELCYDMTLSRQDQLKSAINFLPPFDRSQCAYTVSDSSAYSPLDLNIPHASLLEELSTLYPLCFCSEAERDQIKGHVTVGSPQDGPSDSTRRVARISAHRTLWPITSGYHESPLRDVSPRLQRLPARTCLDVSPKRDGREVEDKNISVGANGMSKRHEGRTRRDIAAHTMVAGPRPSSEIGLSQSWWSTVKGIFLTHVGATPESPPRRHKRSRVEITERFLLPTWDGATTGLTREN